MTCRTTIRPTTMTDWQPYRCTVVILHIQGRSQGRIQRRWRVFPTSPICHINRMFLFLSFLYICISVLLCFKLLFLFFPSRPTSWLPVFWFCLSPNYLKKFGYACPRYLLVSLSSPFPRKRTRRQNFLATPLYARLFFH